MDQVLGSVLVHVVIVFAPPLAVPGHATNTTTGLAIPLQATALPVAVIAAGIWIAYSLGGELYVVALAAAVMLTDTMDQ